MIIHTLEKFCRHDCSKSLMQQEKFLCFNSFIRTNHRPVVKQLFWLYTNRTYDISSYFFQPRHCKSNTQQNLLSFQLV